MWNNKMHFHDIGLHTHTFLPNNKHNMVIRLMAHWEKPLLQTLVFGTTFPGKITKDTVKAALVTHQQLWWIICCTSQAELMQYT